MWNWIKTNAGVLILTIGFCFLGVSFIPEIKSSEFWHFIFSKGSELLIIGGTVGFLTNAAQFAGVFKKELEDIIYSKKYLSKRKDLAEVWENVSKSMIKERFPGISQKLLSAIQTCYLPINSNYYYEEYKIKIEMSWVDKEKKLVKTIEYITVDIVSDTTKKIDIESSSTYKINSDIHDCFRYTKYEVDGVSIMGKRTEKILSISDNERKFVKNYKLDKKNRYHVDKVCERVYSIDEDNDISFRARHLINNLYVEFLHPQDINVRFINRGTIKDYKDRTTYSNTIYKEYKDVLLPNQGYIFVLGVKD